MSATASQMSAPETSGPIDPLDELPVVHGHTVETILEPSRGWMAVPWTEMFRQRELLFFLIWRDIKVRYKQAVLGLAWVVLQPIINVFIFTAIFGAGLNLASRLGSAQDFPYPVFVFAALLPWTLISRSLNEGGMSLVNQQHLLTKIYFPRLFVPTASVGGALFDTLISVPILCGVMAIYHIKVTPMLMMLPVLLALATLLSLGIAYTMSALTVTYRDFRFLIPFMSQILMWGSFIMIPVPEHWHDNWKWRLVLAQTRSTASSAHFGKCSCPH